MVDHTADEAATDPKSTDTGGASPPKVGCNRGESRGNRGASPPKPRWKRGESRAKVSPSCTHLMAKRRKIILVIALFLAFAASVAGGRGIGEIMVTATLTSVAFLATDPWHLLDPFLSPQVRYSAAVLLTCAALACTGWTDPQVLGIVGGITAIVLAICIRRNAALLMDYRVRQSPAVDKVLSELAHGAASEAAEVWELNGCRECRALLHQAVGIECPEPLLTSAHRATYTLGYLHGEYGRPVQREQLLEQIEQLTEQITQLEAWKNDHLWMVNNAKSQMDELQWREKSLSDQLNSERGKVARWEKLYQEWQQERETLLRKLQIATDELDAIERARADAAKLAADAAQLAAEQAEAMTIEQRNREIFLAHKRGENNTQIGKMYGISRTQVGNIIKQEAARQQPPALDVV